MDHTVYRPEPLENTPSPLPLATDSFVLLDFFTRRKKVDLSHDDARIKWDFINIDYKYGSVK